MVVVFLRRPFVLLFSSSDGGDARSLCWRSELEISPENLTISVLNPRRPSLSVSSSEFRLEFCLQKGTHASRSRRNGVNARGGGRDQGGKTSVFVV